jgi:undecaprenyl-diphosphatase
MVGRVTSRSSADPAAGRGWLLVIAGAAAAFVLLTVVVSAGSGPVSRLDAAVSAHAHTAALASGRWRDVMQAVTLTGSTAVLGPLVAAGCLVLLLRGHWRAAVFAAIAMIGTCSLRLIPLALIARPRPPGPLSAASGFSFPSGHSTASAAAALILVLVCRPLVRHRWARITTAAVAGLWASAVGVSRVALVVHWPTDVLGAWLLVLVTVPAVALLCRRLLGPDAQGDAVQGSLRTSPPS